jgi:hypothetical protein
MSDQRDLFTKLAGEFLSEVLKDRENLSGIYVAGVEVTQAIQWYDASQHLTDPADRGPDNGVTLVVNKPAWVRIYVGGFIAHSGVTATLTLQRHNAYGAWQDVYSPIKMGLGSVNYDPVTSYAATRRNLGYTLNFVIPANQMHGSFQLVASLKAASGATATRTTSVNATLLQTLQVRGIPIRYWGPDAAGNQVQLGPTTAAEFASTATWSMLTYPVENVPSISLAGLFTWSEPLSGAATAAGACSTGWNDLLFWLQIAKTIDGNKPDVIYFGLLPVATPNGPVIGCDSTGVSAGISGNGITMAHEMGHYQGFPHSPCGNVGTPDANYPAYEPYDTVGARTASIGEFGLDVSTGTIYDPATAKDYMSYCSPPWTSLYHYNSQIGSSWFNPRFVSSDDRPPWWDHYKLFREYSIPRDLPYPAPVEEYPIHERVGVLPEPSIVVTGMLSDGLLDVRSVLRLDAVRGSGETGPERLEILDAGGAVIRRGAFLHLPLGACGSGGGGGSGSGCCSGCGGLPGSRSECPRVVQAVVPEVEGAVAMRVVRGDEVLWSLEAPKRAHKVEGLRAEIGLEEIALAWRVSGGDASETHLRLSSDRGETWSLLEMGVRTTTTSIPVEVFPPGSGLVQVLVSNGFHTAISQSIEVDVPHRPPIATIHWPLDTATVAASGSMRMWGSGMSAGTDPLPDQAHTWSVDGRQVGIGHDLWVTPPEEDGEHLATLTVRDAHGETSASSRFWVSHSGLAPRRRAH